MKNNNDNRPVVDSGSNLITDENNENNKKKKGKNVKRIIFSFLLNIFILLILVGIGVGGYVVYSLKKETPTELIESYFKAEVQSHVPDAWINADKRDAQDGEIGIVGYEIPFNRHFYVYEPPRDLAEIDADLDAVSREIMALLQEVHS